MIYKAVIQISIKNLKVRFEKDPSLDHIEIVLRAPEQDDSVSEFMMRLSDTPSETLTAYDAGGNLRVLEIEDIVSVSVIKKELTILTETGVYTTRKSLQSLETVLNPLLFIRISRYEIVNIQKIVRYDFTLPGTLKLELNGGAETWASRRCIPQIRQRLLGKEGDRK